MTTRRDIQAMTVRRRATRRSRVLGLAGLGTWLLLAAGAQASPQTSATQIGIVFGRSVVQACSHARYGDREALPQNQLSTYLWNLSMLLHSYSL